MRPSAMRTSSSVHPQYVSALSHTLLVSDDTSKLDLYALPTAWQNGSTAHMSFEHTLYGAKSFSVCSH